VGVVSGEKPVSSIAIVMPASVIPAPAAALTDREYRTRSRRAIDEVARVMALIPD
jgi:hypothetical protein